MWVRPRLRSPTSVRTTNWDESVSIFHSIDAKKRPVFDGRSVFISSTGKGSRFFMKKTAIYCTWQATPLRVKLVGLAFDPL
jgi:hypothetical protein